MIAWLEQTANWLSRIVEWIWRAHRLWIALLAIPTVGLICWAVLSNWEPRIRFTGMSLEVLGLFTVAYGLRETRTLFGRPSLLAVSRDWLRDFPRFRHELRMVAGTAAITLNGVGLSGTATVGVAPTASLEERVAALEKNFNQAHLLIHEAQRKIDREAELRKSGVESEKRAREVGDEKNRQLVEEAAAGGLYLEAIGVLWLFFGIIMATASNELACLFAAK